MSPIISAIKFAGFAAVTIVGAAVVVKRMACNHSDLAVGAIHFRNGINEMGKAFSTIIFGSGCDSELAEKEKERESKRIIIE